MKPEDVLKTDSGIFTREDVLYWMQSYGEAYKSALRKAIKERISKLYDFIRITNMDSPSTITLNRIDTLNQVLDMLDTVNPE